MPMCFAYYPGIMLDAAFNYAGIIGLGLAEGSTFFIAMPNKLINSCILVQICT